MGVVMSRQRFADTYAFAWFEAAVSGGLMHGSRMLLSWTGILTSASRRRPVCAEQPRAKHYNTNKLVVLHVIRGQWPARQRSQPRSSGCSAAAMTY